jgi:integrase
VKPDELPLLAKAINEEENYYGSKALWLYLLLGCRRDELLKAKRSDIDWDRRELRLPHTKAGRVHYIPISEPALAILRELPEEDGNPYLLPGHKTGHHLVNIEKIWRRVRKAAKVEDVRLHDLRRTLGSWLAQSGNSLHLIGRVLNHSSQATTAVYARFGQDNVRQALEIHGKKLMSIAGKQAPVRVLPIKKRVRANRSQKRR